MRDHALVVVYHRLKFVERFLAGLLDLEDFANHFSVFGIFIHNRIIMSFQEAVQQCLYEVCVLLPPRQL